MKRTTLYVVTPVRLLSSGKVIDSTVPCELLHDIAPHLAHIATFALFKDGRWCRIVNVETGGFVSLWFRSVKDALAYKSVLQRVSAQRMRASMLKMINICR